MATPFSRTMRSLKSDGFRVSLAGLLLAMIVLVLWLAWFFLARITLYETSQSATISQAGDITAYFAPTSLGRLSVGQPALVRLTGGAEGMPRAIPAMVMNVKDESKQNRVRVDLYALDLPAELAVGQTGLSGQVEVEVEQVSPALLVARASGLFLHASDISNGPQNAPDAHNRQ